MNRIYKIHANCILVKGHNRSAICDLQRSDYILLPNEVSDLFDNNILELNKCISNLDKDGETELIKYIDYLENSGYIFQVNEKWINSFPELSNEWDYPGQISNAIIEISGKNINDLLECRVIEELYELGCVNIELRLLRPLDYSRHFKTLIKRILKGDFWSIDLNIDDENRFLDINFLKKLTEKHKNIRVIQIFNSLKNELILRGKMGFGGIGYVLGKLDSSCCGLVIPSFFAVNISHYTESLQYNSCLNRKISIDKNGNIKNCPSMNESFGHIKNTALSTAIGASTFKDYWNIKKDKISVCKDCEFRYICTDCRAYLEDPEDIYSKPLKCGYDPYTNVWEEWSNSKFKKAAIEFYNQKVC